MKRKPSKISLAFAFLKANPGITAYAAAKHAGLPPTSVYAALKRIRAVSEGICPECGQVLRKV